jgi:hypothetical protein
VGFDGRVAAVHNVSSARGGWDMGFFSNRRNRIVESYLDSRVRSGTLDADIPNLYFAGACRYAQDHGGTLYPDMQDSIIFDKEIGGDNYSVFFLVGRGGKGVNITLTKQRHSFEIAKENADEYVRRGAEKREPQPSRAVQAIRERVLEGFSTGKVVRFRPAVKQDIEDFFEHYATTIPSKCETDEVWCVRLGMVDAPGVGISLVFAALMMDEALISVRSLPAAPGVSQMETLSAKRDEIQEFQEESFPEFMAMIRAEIEAKRAGTAADR